MTLTRWNQSDETNPLCLGNRSPRQGVERPSIHSLSSQECQAAWSKFLYASLQIKWWRSTSCAGIHLPGLAEAPAWTRWAMRRRWPCLSGSNGRLLVSSGTSTAQTPHMDGERRGAAGGGSHGGAGRVQGPRPPAPARAWGRCLCYSLTVKPGVVINISFLKIKYLSGNMIPSCEKPGRASALGALGQRAVPGQGAGPITGDTALVGPTPSAAPSLSDLARPLVLSVWE